MRQAKQSVILAALETTPGTDAAPTGAANAVLVREQSITPLEAAQADRALVRPYFGASEQLQGAAVVRCTLVVELVGSGVGGVAPAWGALLQACAFAPASGLAGVARVEYQPVTDEPKTATIYYNDSGVLHKLVGAMGTFSLEALVDGIPVLKFELLGLDGGIAAAALPAADYSAWQRPPVVGPASAIDVTLGCTYSEGALVGGTQYTSTGLTLASGNATGLTSFVSKRRIDITAREMVGKTELELSAAQEVAMMAAVKTNSITSLGFAVGISPQLRVLVFCPAVQLTNPTKAERNGVRTLALDLRLLPVAGNDEVLLATSVDATPPAPDLASLEPYRTSATTWKAVPWGAVTWVESSITYSQVVDIYCDLTIAAPPGGRLWAGRAHAAGGAYDITPGSAMDTTLVQPFVAMGGVFFCVSARHPVLSSTPTQFYDRDFGRAIQFIQSLDQAFGLNKAKGHFITQSRGSGVINDLLQADLANPVGTTYAERQSSRGVRLVYAANPQAWHDSADEAPEYLATQADIDAALLAYPPDSRQRNAVQQIATADLAAIPNLVALYDATFQPGKVSWAQMQAAGGVLHYPNQGLSYRAAYAARGLASKCVVSDQSGTGIATIFGAFIKTVQGLEAGLSLPWAMSIAYAAANSQSLIAIPQSLAGVSINSDGSGGTPAVGGNVGGISDKSQGIANTSTTNGAGQILAANKPKLAQVGANYGALFVDGTDTLICQRANSGAAGCLVAWHTNGKTTTVSSQNTSQVVWTVGTGNTQVVAVVGAAPVLPLGVRVHSHLASELAGADLFDPVV